MQVAVLILSCMLMQDQHAHSPAPSEKPVSLLPGMGKYTRIIRTNQQEAQRYFDQGLNLLYGFNRYEAWRSFRKASELDPGNPMPKWGIAMAKGPSINMDMEGDMDMKAYCETLAGVIHPFADAARARCPEGNNAAYIDAMRTLSTEHPDDLDAATLYAEALMIPIRWKWFSKDGSPTNGTTEAIRVLEDVLRRNPDHPGANHLYIHAVEASPNPERAIPSAQRLMGLVPNAGHLVHMPGHIWLITGDYEMAAAVNERAVEVDRSYFQTTGVQGSSYFGYYVHNIHFVAASRMMQGRKADALKAAKEMADLIAPAAAAMPEMLDSFVPYPWLVMERFGQYDDLLKVQKPIDKMPASNALWHWARAMALHGKGQNPAPEVEAFYAAAKNISPEAPWFNSKAKLMLEMAGHILDARIMGATEKGIEHLKAAVAVQDQLNYDEPPPWYMPVRESLGIALLRIDKAEDAETVFREALALSPRNGRILFGLRECLKKQGKEEAAEMVDREFAEAWKKADTTLSLDTMQ